MLLINCILFWASILTAIFAAAGKIPIFIPIIIIVATIIYTVYFVNRVARDPDKDLSKNDLDEIEKKLLEYLRDKDAH